MDDSPLTVTGAHEAQRARVIWRAGLLYIFTSRDDVTVYNEPSRPARSGRRGYVTESGIEMERSGCRCGCVICRLPLTRLVQSADARIASGDLEVLTLESVA